MVWKIFFDDGIKVNVKEGIIEKGDDENTFIYLRNTKTNKLEALPKTRIVRMEEIK